MSDILFEFLQATDVYCKVKIYIYQTEDKKNNVFNLWTDPHYVSMSVFFFISNSNFKCLTPLKLVLHHKTSNLRS